MAQILCSCCSMSIIPVFCTFSLKNILKICGISIFDILKTDESNDEMLENSENLNNYLNN